MLDPPIVSLDFCYVSRRRKEHRSRLLYWLLSRRHALRWRTLRMRWSWAFYMRRHQRRRWHIPCQRCRCSLPRDFPKIDTFSCFGRVWCYHGLRIRARRRHNTLRTRPRSTLRRCRTYTTGGLCCSLVKPNELQRCLAGFAGADDDVRPWRSGLGTSFC